MDAFTKTERSATVIVDFTDIFNLISEFLVGNQDKNSKKFYFY